MAMLTDDKCKTGRIQRTQDEEVELMYCKQKHVISTVGFKLHVLPPAALHKHHHSPECSGNVPVAANVSDTTFYNQTINKEKNIYL